MTVVLVGVGTDTEHARPAPFIDDDGNYEYIPIPETWLTTETRTYGTYELDHREGTATDVIERIRPFGEDGDWITKESVISDHPLHYDPDFESKSYADRRGPGGKGGTMASELESDDVIGFYTGLFDSNDDIHRYIYGYFTVAEVADLSRYEGKEFRDRLRGYPDNAHAKRLAGAGLSKRTDLVVVDGKDPGKRLGRPIQISEKREDRPPTYQLTNGFADGFSVKGGVKAIDRKPALVCRLSAEEFHRKIDDWGGI